MVQNVRTRKGIQYPRRRIFIGRASTKKEDLTAKGTNSAKIKIIHVGILRVLGALGGEDLRFGLGRGASEDATPAKQSGPLTVSGLPKIV
jgi:hypothetical protein